MVVDQTRLTSLEQLFAEKIAWFQQQQNLSQPPKFVIGCSGGPDSLALTLLMQHWLKSNEGAFLAIVVDHNLRTESAKEAKNTIDWLQQQNIPSHALHVDISCSGNMQNFARTQRLNLLSQAAKDFHADAILLAHHENDQAETILDHLARGSHALGLCGIFPVSHYQDQTIFRPLLQINPVDLRHYAQGHHAPIIDDPSNRAMYFRRVQLRQWLSDAPTLKEITLQIGQQALIPAGVELAAARQLLNQTVSEPLKGILQVQFNEWQNYPAMVQQRTLGSLIQYVANRPYQPRRKHLNHAIQWLHKTTKKPLQITINHVRLRLHNSTLWLYPDQQPKQQPLTRAKFYPSSDWWAIQQNVESVAKFKVESQKIGRKNWRKAHPDYAEYSFLGETCPGIFRGEELITPYSDQGKNADYVFICRRKRHLGNDLLKTGLYFDKINPIS